MSLHSATARACTASIDNSMTGLYAVIALLGIFETNFQKKIFILIVELYYLNSIPYTTNNHKN